MRVSTKCFKKNRKLFADLILNEVAASKHKKSEIFSRESGKRDLAFNFYLEKP